MSAAALQPGAWPMACFLCHSYGRKRSTQLKRGCCRTFTPTHASVTAASMCKALQEPRRPPHPCQPVKVLHVCVDSAPPFGHAPAWQCTCDLIDRPSMLVAGAIGGDLWPNRTSPTHPNTSYSPLLVVRNGDNHDCTGWCSSSRPPGRAATLRRPAPPLPSFRMQS